MHKKPPSMASKNKVSEPKKKIGEGVVHQSKSKPIQKKEPLHDEHVHGEHCQHDHDHAETLEKPETFVRTHPKLGRNDPCSCGSGKKYKKCCLS